MNCFFGRIAIAVLVLVGATAGDASAESITYAINNYASYQSGYTLSGTITTDGTIGTLHSANVTAWSVTISNGSGSETFASGAGASAYLQDNVESTSTTIYLPYGGIIWLFGANGDQILWDSYGEYKAMIGGGSTTAWYEASSPPTPWVVATAIPEPSSLTMLGFGMVTGLGGMVYRRRRRATSTNPSHRID